MTEGERPKQFAIDEKWDHVIDLSLRRTVYGTVAGGLTGLLLFSELSRIPQAPVDAL